MNGRRVRGAKFKDICKFNKQIQFINSSIAESKRILSKLDRVLMPNDWMGDRIIDNFQYNTWRTVGVLNMTDHFIVRYLERVENKYITDVDLRNRFGYYNIKESDEMKIRMLEYDNFFTDEVKQRIREFVKNPPSEYTVIRQDERLITILDGNIS